jgi:hypothetical protein
MPLLPKLAGVIRQCLRGDTDFVARFGDEEFVVLMPQTSLAGASVFGDRLRKRVAEELGSTVCCGITIAESDDDAKSLLARPIRPCTAPGRRADRMFLTGTHIHEHPPAYSRRRPRRRPGHSQRDNAHPLPLRRTSHDATDDRPLEADGGAVLHEAS